MHERLVPSTMDIAHALAAEGAPAGVLVVADRQSVGRGRGGNRWASADGAGLWMTRVERPADPRALGVLSLRLGLALAQALAPFVDQPLGLKWPNDVFAGDGKLAGILVEARWRDAHVDWVAIGIGINRRAPIEWPGAAAVRDGVSRATLLQAVIPRVRAAAMYQDVLTDDERAAWHDRDMARGRRVRAPGVGIVAGIAADGALLIAPDRDGIASAFRSGSLLFDDDRADILAPRTSPPL